MNKADILILGAGCAGTSLAHYLETFGYSGKVVLLDSRTKFDREQRWCSWSKTPESFSYLSNKKWQQWTVCDTNQKIVKTSDKFSYQQIYAPEFFDYFHSRWQNSNTPINLNLGEKVEHIENTRDGVEVTCENQTWQAQLVFDARHQGSPYLKNAKKSKSVYLHQTFVGWVVKFPRAVFDERNATLMDFRTRQKNGINFIYVLPYSKNEALVESTSFSRNAADRQDHLYALKQYISENFGDDYVIEAEESGELPMTGAHFKTKISERIFAVGVAGGGARASSGYAFQRIQRQTSQIAKAIVEKKKIPQKFAPRKYDFFDKVFLEAIESDTEGGKNLFMKLFERVAPDSLIRFLTDESSYSDDLAVISALPKKQFGKACFKSSQRIFEAQNKTDEEFQISPSNLHNSVDKSAGRLVAWHAER